MFPVYEQRKKLLTIVIKILKLFLIQNSNKNLVTYCLTNRAYWVLKALIDCIRYGLKLFKYILLYLLGFFVGLLIYRDLTTFGVCDLEIFILLRDKDGYMLMVAHGEK